MLYYKKKPSDVEREYKKTLLNVDSSKLSNNMYINNLQHKLLIKLNGHNYDSIKLFEYEEFKKYIISYISSVVSEMKNYNKLTDNWTSNIKQWENYIKNYDSEFENRNNVDVSDKKMEEYVESAKLHCTFDENKIGQKAFKKVKLSENTKSESNYFKQSIESIILESIGRIGEEIVWNILLKEHGYEKVRHTSRFNKYSPYDLKYKSEDGSWRYVEVKSTTRMDSNWWISRNEYEFYKKHSESYEIVFVQNVNPKNNQLPFVIKISNPKIEVLDEQYGFDGNKLFITPSNYRGYVS